MFDVFQQPYPDSNMLPMVRSPWPILIIVGIYLLFVLKLGRKFMENREPYQLGPVLKWYNIVQVIYNLAMGVIGFYVIVCRRAYVWNCMETLPEDNPLHTVERWLTYSYYLNKILDLMDTIFFILRKSYKQITVLHVYHHALMTLAGYAVIRFYGYGGHPFLMGQLNTIIHVFMYAYYYLAATSKDIKNSFWWKRYITIIQLVQFVLIFVHSVATYYHPNCPLSPYLIYLTGSMSLVMMIMFSNFYIHTYILPKKKKEQ